MSMSGQSQYPNNPGRGRGGFGRGGNNQQYDQEFQHIGNSHQKNFGQPTDQAPVHFNPKVPPPENFSVPPPQGMPPPQGTPPGFMIGPQLPAGPMAGRQSPEGQRSRSGERNNQPQSGARERSQSGGRNGHRSGSGGREGAQSGHGNRSQSGDRARPQSGERPPHGNAGDQTKNRPDNGGARDRSRSGERGGQQQNRNTRWDTETQDNYQGRGGRPYRGNPRGNRGYSHNYQGHNQGNYGNNQGQYGYDQDNYGNNQGQYGYDQGNYDNNQGSYRNKQGYNRGHQNDWNNSGNSSWQPRRKEGDGIVFLSKTLSSILRHNAERFGFKLMKGGFLYVDEILQRVQKLKGFTIEDIEYVVASNDKQRFTLEKEANGRTKIRANQGHTLEVEELDLKPITSAGDYPWVIHGTYFSSWEMIKRTGLCRMKRNHIHFAAGEPGQDGVISGMRSSCEVMIYIDLEKAMKDGLKFFVSSNNVILCPGNDEGYLFPCYFQGAKDRRKQHRLDFDHSISSLKRPANAEGSSTDQSGKKSRKNKKKNREERDVEENPQPEGKPKQKRAEAAAQEPEEDIYEDAEENLTEQSTDVPDKWEDASDDKPKSVENASNKKPKDVENASDKRPKKEEKQTKKEEASVAKDSAEPPKKKDAPAWTDPPTMLSDVDRSKSAVDHIMTTLSPDCVTVCCCGRSLGTQDSDITMIVILAQPEIYVYHFQDQDDKKSMMNEGRLKEFLMTKEIKKIFHNIGSVSPSLIHECDVFLNSVPITDIALVMDKCTLSGADKEKIQEKFGIKWPELNKTMKSWDIENGDMAKTLATPGSSLDVRDTLVKRGKLIHELYQLCSSHISEELEKKMKKDIYQLAIPGSTGHFLLDKIGELRQANKQGKKANKAKSEEGNQDATQASTSQSQAQGTGQGQKKGKAKNKKKK